MNTVTGTTEPMTIEATPRLLGELTTGHAGTTGEASPVVLTNLVPDGANLLSCRRKAVL